MNREENRLSYSIETKEDPIKGMLVQISIPERELDRIALETIQDSQPPFLLPFRYKIVNNQVEFTYQLGKCTKVKHYYSTKDTEAYIQFWESILLPFKECRDWFLSPFCFVMDIDYLFYTEDRKHVNYLYLPSVHFCSTGEDMGVLVRTLLNPKNGTKNLALENEILHTQMSDFRLNDFLTLLKKYKRHDVIKPVEKEQTSRISARDIINKGEELVAAIVEKKEPAQDIEQKQQEIVPVRPQTDGEFDIDLSDIPDGVDDKKAKPKKQKAEKKPLFSFGKKNAKKANEVQVEVASKISSIGQNAWIKPEAAVKAQPIVEHVVHEIIPQPIVAEEDDGGETTVLEGEDNNRRVGLRLANQADLPRNIDINIAIGESFTIGRFDVKVGKKQSDFEFHQRTSAVSRHHAVIEKMADGYYLSDLSSKAGTFVDGRRLRANAPMHLKAGSKVSFGTAGADYIWDE